MDVPDKVEVVLHAGVGRGTQGEELPHHHAEGPDVRLGGEDALLDGLDGHPLHREQTLRGGRSVLNAALHVHQSRGQNRTIF